MKQKPDDQMHNFLKNCNRLKTEFKIKANTPEFTVLWKACIETQQWLIKIGVIKESDMMRKP